jgi:FtsZ-interacting cell division protein YlmF
MASLWQKTMFYLGLVDDDEIEAAEAAVGDSQRAVRTVEPPKPAKRERQIRSAGAIAGRRIEPPAPVRRRVSENAEHAEAGVLVTSGHTTKPVRSFDRTHAQVSAETAVIEARTLSDAQTLADHIREGRPVVLDLRDTETAMVRRLVDFSSGLTYALDGRMAKIATGVILVTPAGTTVGVEERRRLASLGLYDTGLARD